MSDDDHLPLPEAASLTSGADFWQTTAAGGLRSLFLADGPHGLRKQVAAADHLGLDDSLPATCFPPAVALGTAWSPALAHRVAAAIAAEALSQGVDVVLGPGMNIKRTPVCGRNFEYFAEDPMLSASLATAMVRGLQELGVGASVKHFAANNQETNRFEVSADIDERPLREIYLRGFEQVVRQARPWTVMCSYNRINGIHASHNAWLLTALLREEWGFDGLVMSDWGAVVDRVRALQAGLDLEMPSTHGRTDAEIVAAVNDGELDRAVLDTAVARLQQLVDRCSGAAPGDAIDSEAHHALAVEAAAASIVLLDNPVGALPLAAEQSVAVIGRFATEPRIQGSGSSRVHPTRVDVPLDCLRAISPATTFAAGYPANAHAGVSEAEALQLREEAVRLAEAADAALVFVGLPDGEESEGFDREHLRLPEAQLAMVDAVASVNPRTVVIVTAGAPVELPFADDVAAIVYTPLLGQGGGSALAEVIYGRVNPSGKLAETFPLALGDTPAFGNFPGEFDHVRYGEGILVGYRWYDTRQLPVQHPFGHGLSYTSFAYAEPTFTQVGDDIELRVQVTNTGDVAGREVVQLYAHPSSSRVQRAARELVGFAEVTLAAGASEEVRVHVPRQALAFWDSAAHRWLVEGGPWVLEVGASSRDLRQQLTVEVRGDPPAAELSLDSTVGELLLEPLTAGLMLQALASIHIEVEPGNPPTITHPGLRRVAEDYPVRRVLTLPEAPFGRDELQAQLSAANERRRDLST